MVYRILLADDHQIILDGLKALLKAESDFEIVGRFSDGRDVVGKAGALRPDIVITDISMPGMNGIEMVCRLRARHPSMKVLCLSMHSDINIIASMLEAGAAGYLLKDDAAEMLLQATHAVLRGQSFLSPSIANSVISLVRHGKRDPDAPFARLSSREREVLQLIAEGQSTHQIAAMLFISSRTVGSHRESLKQKLGISSIAGLTRYALQYGLTQ